MEKNVEQNVEQSVEKNQGKKSNKKRNIFIIILLFALVVVCLLFGLKSCQPVDLNNNNKPTFDLSEDANAQSGGIDGKSKEEIEAELNKKVADGMINISMNMSVTFESGTSDGNLLIVNEEINKYPQVVEIYRDDNDDLIYKSGGIPVGSKVETGKLLVDLDKGVYDCTAYFNAVNPETNELIGKAGAKITVTVLN